MFELVFCIAAMFIGIILFLIFKPNYTANAAQHELSKSYENVSFDRLSDSRGTPHPSRLIKHWYIFTGESENEEIIIVFNPINGNYVTHRLQA